MHLLSLSLVVAFLLAGCGGSGTVVKRYENEKFRAGATYSRKVALPTRVVCHSVKRAMLSQGYLLDQGPGNKDSPLLVGTKSWQPENDVAVTLRLQVTCVHEGETASSVFATGIEESYKLQEVTGSVSAGVSIATITVPSTSGRALMLVRRETIEDPQFYARFYSLVEQYAKAEHDSEQSSLAESDSPAKR